MATAHEELARLTAAQLTVLRAMLWVRYFTDRKELLKAYDLIEDIAGLISRREFLSSFPEAPPINYHGYYKKLRAENEAWYKKVLGIRGCCHGADYKATAGKLTDWILWMTHSSDFTEVRNSWASRTQD